jgi:arsenate reductase-like glutaredoxin family protein
MQIPIIITKEDCHRCHELVDWLKEHEVEYSCNYERKILV